MPLRAAHDRLRRENVCELGVVDKPLLCPRMRPRVRVPLLRAAVSRCAGHRISELRKGLTD